MRNKCPACTLPIGLYRSRIMERVVTEVLVPCPNAKHGCKEKFSYGKELAHEKKCAFAPCYCPARNCNYSGVYKDLYSHYDVKHRVTSDNFSCGYPHNACVSVREGLLVLEEYRDGPLVVVQSFKEPQGVCVSVNCIAPSAPGVVKYSYELSYSRGGNNMTFGSGEMNRIRKVSFETPEKDFMLIPYYHQGEVNVLKVLHICIRRVVEEEEAEEEEEEHEDEDED
uniref:E3 ubiquitin-protein ligase SINA-like 2 n=1 Tax=Noccaea caerulescens TaxID=107243 RepID=A0A1J3G9H6_NOCCA